MIIQATGENKAYPDKQELRRVTDHATSGKERRNMLPTPQGSQWREAPPQYVQKPTKAHTTCSITTTDIVSKL